jgi:cell division protein FtsB
MFYQTEGARDGRLQDANRDLRAENERLKTENAELLEGRTGIVVIRQLRAENERLTEEANDLDSKLGSALRAIGLEHADNERLRAALEKIASSGNVHSSWLVGDAREALGLPRNTW